MENSNADAIKLVIERAYIQGIHGNQDLGLVQSGFHKDFAMLVLQSDVLERVTVDDWLIKVVMMKEENPDLWEAETEYAVELTDVTGDAAVTKLEVYKGAIHFSTDYMLLYRFEEGWRIVSKIFAVPS